MCVGGEEGGREGGREINYPYQKARKMSSWSSVE